MKKRTLILFIAIFLMIFSSTTVIAKRNVALEESYAVKLKELGLFYGVGGNDFDLERAPTRIEALVMLIRVLGKESEATSGSWEHPFTDVPSWADKYVGYAYEKKLANGVALTRFGTSNATSAQYLTFMLRALGYSDADGKDFTWDNPYELARYAEILPSTVDTNNFWRADVASISYASLSAKIKDSSETLAERLIKANVFTREKYEALTSNIKFEALSSVEISELCANSVFYIEVYSYNGAPLSSGSGFFISDDGYAITNHHVVSGGRFMKALSPDGTVYDKITVVDTYEKQDLALIKIDHSEKVDYLEFGDSTILKQGQKVYAIGSPQGLENTMSEGIISNLSRTLGEMHYIQISVPIDQGSSGGALLDEYGKVVGVTSAGITGSGSDLNFIVPIQYAYELDKNADAKSATWYTNCYPLFSTVYDFGAFTGIEISGIRPTNYGYHIIYNGNDTYDVLGTDNKIVYTKENSYNYCLDEYKKALVQNGLIHTKVNNADRFENDIEYIEIEETDNKEITIIVELKKKYYAEAEGLIDAEWYLGVDFTGKDSDSDKYTYHYSWGDAYTVEGINEALTHYINEICAPTYTALHTETDKSGKLLVYLTGKALLITLEADASTLSITIAPFNTVTLDKYFDMLSAYIKKNSTSSVSGKHSIVSKSSEDKYMLSYSEKDDIISFAGNVKLPDTEIQVYIRINNSGTGNIEVIFARDSKQTVYKAAIFTNSFGKNITPKQTYYNGSNLSSDANMAISACVTVLKRCEENILANTTLTLEKIGFKNLDS